MALSGPDYPTEKQAEDAVVTLGTALATRKLNTPEELQAAWTVSGYGLSLGFGTPSANMQQLKQATRGASSFNWFQIVQIVLQILSGMTIPTGS